LIEGFKERKGNVDAKAANTTEDSTSIPTANTIDVDAVSVK